MITKVRIAPVEQWCDRAKENLERNPAIANTIGIEIEIETQTFENKAVDDFCSGPWWALTRESSAHVYELVERPEFIENTRLHLCRHVLEMD